MRGMKCEANDFNEILLDCSFYKVDRVFREGFRERYS